MVQSIAQLTPAGVTLGVACVGGGGLIVGTLLWLAGSRFSRALVTLAAVGVGAFVGKKMPGWMHSEIDPMGTCFGVALALGILGYMYHRMWVGAGLGLLLAGWAAVLTWQVMAPDQRWACPELPQALDFSAIGQALWDSLPAAVQKVMPWAAGGAALVGMALGEFCPRFAGRLFYSVLGLSVVGTAALLMKQTSNWTSRAPASVVAQVGVAAVLVTLGVTVQWWLGPRRAPVADSPSPEQESIAGAQRVPGA